MEYVLCRHGDRCNGCVDGGTLESQCPKMLGESRLRASSDQLDHLANHLLGPCVLGWRSPRLPTRQKATNATTRLLQIYSYPFSPRSRQFTHIHPASIQDKVFNSFPPGAAVQTNDRHSAQETLEYPLIPRFKQSTNSAHCKIIDRDQQ